MSKILDLEKFCNSWYDFQNFSRTSALPLSRAFYSSH